MEILKNFGFDPVLLTAQIINFLIILYLLKRFLFKPILLTLKKREDEIDKGLKNAEEGKKVLEEALEKEKDILSKARAESEKIISEANSRAAKKSEEALEKAKMDTQRLIDQAKESLERDRKDAEAELEERVTKLAIEILEKSLGKILSKKEQALITEKAIREIK